MIGGFASAPMVSVPTTVQHNSYCVFIFFSSRRKNGEEVNKELNQELSYQISMVLKSAKPASAAAVSQAPSIPSRMVALFGTYLLIYRVLFSAFDSLVNQWAFLSKLRGSTDRW